MTSKNTHFRIVLIALALLAAMLIATPAANARDGQSTNDRHQQGRPATESAESDTDDRPPTPPDVDLSITLTWADCVMTAIIFNTGADAAGPFDVTIGPDITVPIAGLAGNNASTTVDIGPVFPSALFDIFVDSGQDQDETNEGNNTANAGIPTGCWPADLVITNVINIGCDVYFEVTNLGNTATGGPTDGTATDPAGSTTATEPIPDLAPGDVWTSTVPLTLPWSATTTSVVLDVDVSGSVAELDEDNAFTFVLPADCDGNGAPLSFDLGSEGGIVDCVLTLFIFDQGTDPVLETFEVTIGDEVFTVTDITAGWVELTYSGPFTGPMLDIFVDSGLDIEETNEGPNSYEIAVPDECLPEQFQAPSLIDLAASSSFASCTYTITIENNGPDDAVDPFVVIIGDTTHTVNGLNFGSSVQFTVGPTFTSPTIDIIIDEGVGVIDIDGTSNAMSIDVPPNCLPELGAKCSAMYVNVFRSDGSFRLYELDDNGELAWDYGTFGLDRILEIGWDGDTLVAYGADSSGHGLFELDLVTGTHTVIAPLSAGHYGLGGGAELVMSTGQTSAHDIVVLDPFTTTNTIMTLPMISSTQMVGDVAVNPSTDNRSYSVLANGTGSLVTLNTAGAQVGSIIGNTPKFTGMTDRGGALFGHTQVGDIFEIDLNAGTTSLFTANPAYANRAKVYGAASYWEEEVCDPWAATDGGGLDEMSAPSPTDNDRETTTPRGARKIVRRNN